MISRKQQINRLKKEQFDLLVIGGGASGAGIAFDAALRGYRTALVDAGDFGGQTSSKSTKLIHGGVRYLEQAFTELDPSRLSFVKSSLKERSIILKIAPHLSRPVSIVIPAFSWFQVCYYWLGMKIYDFLSSGRQIGKSRFFSKTKVFNYFPEMKKSNRLKGGILYFDGQFDDARLNLSLILSSMHQGTAAANYVRVVDFHHRRGLLSSAVVEDRFSQEKWEVEARAIVNATGPFSDRLRQMDNPFLSPKMVGSIGTHLVLNKKFSPKGVGILIPKTSDGRVLFLLPWKNYTLVGTTDIPTGISENPYPSEEEVEYLLKHLKDYLGIAATSEDIYSKWSGIRPLVLENKSANTAKLSRDFVIEKSASGLYSLMGGKWTSYRKMAETLLDKIIENGDLPQYKECQTMFTPVEGGEALWEGVFEFLSCYDQDIQDHLYQTYGSKSVDVVKLAKDKGLEKRLHPDHPYIEAEVLWSVLEEMAVKPDDFLNRRIRLMMLDQNAADQVIAKVEKLMDLPEIAKTS